MNAPKVPKYRWPTDSEAVSDLKTFAVLIVLMAVFFGLLLRYA